jgi:hypothetical protein
VQAATLTTTPQPQQQAAMPRVSSLASAASTLQAACDLVGEASNLSSLSRMKSFGEGVCTCARCMRRAGPIREDVE